jgi:hypothetical protein
VGRSQGPATGDLPHHVTFSEAKNLSRTVTSLELLIVVALRLTASPASRQPSPHLAAGDRRLVSHRARLATRARLLEVPKLISVHVLLDVPLNEPPQGPHWNWSTSSLREPNAFDRLSVVFVGRVGRCRVSIGPSVTATR